MLRGSSEEMEKHPQCASRTAVADPSASMTGDMTKSVQDCGLLHQFRIASNQQQISDLEIPLETPLSLEVGGAGILGRRVSMLRDNEGQGEQLVADGIVGFNCIPTVAASL